MSSLFSFWESQKDVVRLLARLKSGEVDLSFLDRIGYPTSDVESEYVAYVNAKAARIARASPPVWMARWTNEDGKDDAKYAGSIRVTGISVAYKRLYDDEPSQSAELTVTLASGDIDGEAYAVLEEYSRYRPVRVSGQKEPTHYLVRLIDVERAVIDLCGIKGAPEDPDKHNVSREAHATRQYFQRRRLQMDFLKRLLSRLRWRRGFDSNDVSVSQLAPTTPTDGDMTVFSIGDAGRNTFSGSIMTAVSRNGRAPQALHEQQQQQRRTSFEDRVKQMQQSVAKLVDVHEHALNAVKSMRRGKLMPNVPMAANLFFLDQTHSIAACSGSFQEKRELGIDDAASTLGSNKDAKEIKTKLGLTTDATPMQILVAVVMSWALHSALAVREINLVNAGGPKGRDAYFSAAHANELKIYHQRKHRMHPLTQMDCDGFCQFVVPDDPSGQQAHKDGDPDEKQDAL